VFKYEINVDNDKIYVSISANSPNERALLIYEGSEKGVAMVRDFVKNSYGAFGHTIGEATSPIDLHYAMSNQKVFQATLIEGQDLAEKYDPDIPEGAVT
jgi:hypothetical protein